MLITESELRSIIRQTILAETRLDEGKALDVVKGAAKKFTSNSMIKILTMLMLVSGGANAGFAQEINKITNKIIQEMNLPAEQANQMRLVAAKLGDKLENKNITTEEVKKAGNELAVYASGKEIPPKTFFTFLKNLVKKIKIKLKPASKTASSSSTIDLYNSDKNSKLVIKEKGNYYYAHDSAYGDFYFKAKKELVESLIAEDKGDDRGDDRGESVNENDKLDALYLYLSVKEGNSGWSLSIGPALPVYDSFLKQCKQQKKLKKEFNSI